MCISCKSQSMCPDFPDNYCTEVFTIEFCYGCGLNSMQFLSSRESAISSFLTPSLTDFFRYVKSLLAWKSSWLSWQHLPESTTSHVIFGLAIHSIMWCLLLFNFFHDCQHHHYLDCLSYLPWKHCTLLSCSLRTLQETSDKENTDKKLKQIQTRQRNKVNCVKKDEDNK